MSEDFEALEELAEILKTPQARLRMGFEDIPGTIKDWEDFLHSVPGRYLSNWLSDTVKAIQLVQDTGRGVELYHAQGAKQVANSLLHLFDEALTTKKKQEPKEVHTNE